MYSGCLCLFLFIQTVLSLTLCSVPFPFCSDFSSMASSYESRRPLPKFGEWDVNDPGSADAFTVIFNQARDEKKSGGDSGSSKRILKDDDHDDRKENVEYKYPKKRKWFCCG